jgi:pimeloyl-ACP methyl ester carboxylesterase
MWKRATATACLIIPLLSAQRLSDVAVAAPIPQGSTLIIGFLGGFERWNDEHRSVRKLVVEFNERPGVYAASISNHKRGVALELIRAALDANRDGVLDTAEKASARIILFGQSWGGAAAVATARDLQRLGISVLLTVQVDSVGLHDNLIPSNVHAAVNFFQHDPFTIQGRREIRAQDPDKTHIIGNFAESYLMRDVDWTDASWARRTLGGGHAKLERDPAVWTQVAQYISNAIERR